VSGCNGDLTGEIEIIVSGGTSPYYYSIDNGTTWSDAGENEYTGLAAGDYNVAVKDANDCFVFGGLVTITEPALVDITDVAVTDVALCYGDLSGEIDITVTGGTTPYYYSIDDGETWSLAGENVFTGLAAGDYYVVVKDDNDCSLTDHIDCNGNANGEIFVFVDDGTPPYTYYLERGTPNEVSNTSGYFTSLLMGAYNLEIEDANACILSLGDFMINEPTELALVLDGIVDPACNGGSTGTIDLTVSGGSPVDDISVTVGGAGTAAANGLYALVASPPPGDWDPANGVFSNGDFYIYWHDGSGCWVIDDDLLAMNLDELYYYDKAAHENLAYVQWSEEVFFEADLLGQAPAPTSIAVQENYDFSWTSTDPAFVDPGTEDLTGLAAGDYTVIVSDAFGCEQTDTYTVGEPTPITYLFVGEQHVSPCFGDQSGEIMIIVSGGTPDPVYAYEYSIDDGTTWEQNGGHFTNLYAGSYDVWVRDANGCEVEYPSNSVQVTELPIIEVSDVVVTNTSCFTVTDGEIIVIASGGTNNLVYSIDDGATYQASNIFSNLLAGDYLIQVMDDLGCDMDESVPVTVEVIEYFSIDEVTYTDVQCFDANDGSITVTATGAPLGLYYSIDGVDYSNTTGIFTDLLPGVYTVSVKNVFGCEATWTPDITILEPTLLVIDDVLTTNVTGCAGSTNATITVLASGGTPAYSYSITNGTSWQASNYFDNLPAGDYDVVVMVRE